MQGEFVLFAQVSGEGWGTPAYAGKCSHTCTRTRHCRLTPAFAGNMLIQRGFFGLNQEDPRVRGEYRSLSEEQRGKLGRPPRARGILNVRNTFCGQARLTPAFAGNIERAEHLLRSGKVDPRVRGEY